MSDFDALDERLRAVERALTDDDRDLTDLRNAAELAREVESLREQLDATEVRLDELDAATQALRGYVGNVRAVNETVERRADAALAKAEALEADRAADSANWPPESEAACGCERRRSDRSNAPAKSDSRPSSVARPRSSATHSPSTSTAPNAADSDRADGALARVGRLLGLR